MDEETNQLDCTAIATVIAAVTSYDNPECLQSPEDFAAAVLEIIQNGVKRINPSIYSCQDPVFTCQHSNSSHQHTSCSCSDVATCSECMTLSALSAVETIFEFFEERNTYTKNSSGNAVEVDTKSKDNIEATVVDCLHVKQCHSRIAVESWYLDAARLLSSRTSIDLLVKCLISSNKFKSFLARKVLISGMNADLIEVFQVLATLKQEHFAVVQLCVPLLEILRDMMSRKKCKNIKINFTTFSFFKEVEFLDFMRARFSETKKSFHDTSGFLEYLSLLCKVVKYVVCSCKRFDTEDMAFLFAVVEKVCLPFGDYLFTIPRVDKGHLICLEYVKVINLILDKRFLENSSAHQEKICKISHCLRPKIHTYLKMAEDCGLLGNVSFIGNNLNLKTKNNINSTSSLKRLIILLVLKTSAVTLKGKGDYTVHIEHDLETFWKEISSSVSISKRHESRDWLPVVFADQDDQWITALICLLIIHKELDKCRQGVEQELRPKSGKTINCQVSFSPNLQQTICPHRLFLQLVRFIDYDHLVLSDFLTSPETPFLFYFTQYLHVIIEDWQGFLSSFVNDVQMNSVNQSNVYELEHSVSGKCSEFESTKHMSFPELSTSRDLQLRNLNQNSDRGAQVFLERNNPLPCYLSREVLTASASTPQCLNSVAISPVHSSQPQHSLLQSSLSQDNYKSLLPVKSCLAFQSYEGAASESFAYNTSGSVLCTLNPTIAPSDTSSSCNATKAEHSFNQYSNNQENADSQHHKGDDEILGMCNRVTSRSCTSLVAYSDSDSEISLDSETSMTGYEANCILGKESVEEHLSNVRNVSEVGSRVDANIGCVYELDSESEDSSVPELGSSTGSVGDHYVKGNGELDAVMGMMIRLRLHVERLEHNKLFPYNVKSLLKLLESCEELYEMPVGS